MKNTRVDLEAFAAAHAEGLTTAQLAERFGIVTTSASRIRRRLGLQATKTTIDDTELVQLVEDGWTTPQLAARYHVQGSTIRSHRQRLGISAPPTRPNIIDRDRVKTLILEKHTHEHIANLLGCHPDSIGRIRAELGISEHHPRPNAPWTDERKAAIQARLEDGWSHAEIARTEGCDVSTIAKYFPGTAWTRKQQGEHTAALRALSPFNKRPRKHNPDAYRAAA